VNEKLPNGENLNVVTLRDYIETLIERDHRSHDRQHELEQRARLDERDSVSLRLEKLNELRSEVVKDRIEYVRRDVFDSQYASLGSRLAELEKNMVRTDALNAHAAEVAKTRKALVYTIVVGGVLAIINFIVNAIQISAANGGGG